MKCKKQFFGIACLLTVFALILPAKHLLATGDPATDSTYRALIQQGQNYLHQNQWIVALDVFKNALQLKNTPDAYAGIAAAEFGIAKLNDDAGDFLKISQKAFYLRAAISNYQDAIKLDSLSLALKYELAEIYLYRREPKDLRYAAELLEQVRAKDLSYRDTLTLLEKIYGAQWEPEKVAEVNEDYSSVAGTNAHALLQKAISAAEHDSLQLAEKYYMQALDDTSRVAQFVLFEDVQPLFSNQDKENYRNSMNKSAFLRTFWLVRDPTPKTAENERIQEHLRRVAYACKNFRSPDSPKRYDDRGMVYIKYGEPSYRYIDSPEGARIYPNESWTYDYVLGENKDGLVYDFANKSKFGYTIIKDLEEAVVVQSTGIRAGYISGLGNPLIREQVALATLFPDRRLYEARADINYAYYGPLTYNTFSPADIAGKHRDFVLKKEQAYLHAPADLFVYKKNPANQIPLTFEHACFRGENGSTRYEIYYGIPLDALKFTKEKKYQTEAFNQDIVVRDAGTKQLYSDSRTVELEYDQDKSLKHENYTGEINFELPPQPYQPVAHFTLEDPNNAQMTLAYWQLPNRNFYGDSLMVSDTKFSYYITPSRDDDPFTHNGFKVIPLTKNRFIKKNPIFVYFEVYNLLPDEKNDVQYRLQCTVQKIANETTWGFNSAGKSKSSLSVAASKKSNEYLSIENSMTGAGALQTNYFTLDMNKLDEGVYDFSLKVIDLRSNQTASTQRNIVLVKK